MGAEDGFVGILVGSEDGTNVGTFVGSEVGSVGQFDLGYLDPGGREDIQQYRGS